MIKLWLALGSMMVAILMNWWYLPPSKHVHYHAGFRVYINGIKQDYSKPIYMNFTPCSEHEQELSQEEEQIEKAHLHEQVGEVVHVHRKGAKWGDLFTNIRVDFDEEVHGYINGVAVKEIMKEEITPYSTAILVVGEDNPVLGKEQIPREQIAEVEKQGEICGS